MMQPHDDAAIMQDFTLNTSFMVLAEEPPSEAQIHN